MTVLYSRERVKEVLRPLSLATAHRIVLKPYLSDPLAVRPSKSRFCDGRTYAVRYAAGDLPRHSPKSSCAIAWCNVIGASCLLEILLLVVGLKFPVASHWRLLSGNLRSRIAKSEAD